MDRSYIPAHVPDYRKKYHIRNAIASAKDVSFPWPGHLWLFNSENPSRRALQLPSCSLQIRCFSLRDPMMAHPRQAAAPEQRCFVATAVTATLHGKKLVSFHQGIFGSPSSSEHPSPGALRVIIWSSIYFSRALHRSGSSSRDPSSATIGSPRATCYPCCYSTRSSRWDQ